MKSLAKNRRRWLVAAPLTLVGCAIVMSVAQSQPPAAKDPSVDSTYASEPTPTPVTSPARATSPLNVQQDAPVAQQQQVAQFNGTVTISSPVRRSDIAVSSVPLGTADWQHRRVNVTFSEAVPTGATVQFIVLNVGANAGDAQVVENANRRTNGTITLEGIAQTQPGSAGILKVVCLVNGVTVGESNGFSVCAHPNGVNYKLLQQLSAFQEPITGGLFWGALYGNEFQFIGSDSGNANDLGEISINETIIPTTTTGLFAGNNYAVGGFTPAPLGLADLVGVTGSSANAINQQIEASGTSSQLVAEQYHTFACGRCGIVESAQSPKVSNSGFRNFVTVSKSTTGANRYYVRCRKSAFDGNGVARGTVDNNLTQTIEIK